MTRREAMKLMMKTIALASIPAIPRAALASPYPKPPLARYCSGRLQVLNAHTEEQLKVRYLDRDGRLDRGAIEALDNLFRCHYTDKVYPIPPELYMLLDAVRTKVGAGDSRYELISGYRSPEYNRMLRRKGRGVARKSYHVQGMAADICLEGVSLRRLHRAALSLEKGGVGKYRDFVHVDIGPVRSW